MMYAGILSDYAVTPMAAGSMANFSAVDNGQSALRYFEHPFGLPEGCMASLFDRDALSDFVGEKGHGLTFFEKLAVASAWPALILADIDPADPEVACIVSTTKANVELIGTEGFTTADVAAGRIAGALGLHRRPVVVSNACISGLAAQICAMRMIRSGVARYVVVTGADAQSRFIISGFQSFKALSADACRPFDKDRCGLNVGEASATIVYAATPGDADEWILAEGAIRNDANHISGPSRTGDGAYACLRALESVAAGKPAFINAHGTATVYNDEMEAVAINHAGLGDVAVNSLKGYFGHTMGAAGVLETIMSKYSADAMTLLPTRGFSESGVSVPLQVSARHRQLPPVKSFVKLMSGFGGCNAAALFRKGGSDGSIY